jgi:hypothetical protein
MTDKLISKSAYTMGVDTITFSEVLAYRLLIKANEIPMITNGIGVHEAANRIIELAERIKAERSAATMWHVQGAV